MVHPQPRTRVVLAWCWWLATFGCCAAGLVGALVVTRPHTVGLLTSGAGYALVFPLGYASVGLVLSLRRPANPIGWLYAASGLAWSLNIPGQAWLDHLVGGGHPLPLAAQLAAVVGELNWDPAIVFGIILPALLVPDGRLPWDRWRLVVGAAVAGAALDMVGVSLTPGPLPQTPIVNPFGLGGMAGTVAAVLAGIGQVLLVVTLVAALVCGLAVPVRPRAPAAAIALGRRRRQRCRGRAAGRACGGLPGRGVRAGRGGRGGAALPAVGPGPPG
jgi:hypothetical protein